MDVLGWIWFALSAVLGLGWSIVWFLLGGWVVTLAQIAVIVMLVFGYKYGWSRAPVEFVQRASAIGRFVWAWVRARERPAFQEATQNATRGRATGRASGRQSREVGDVNLSTLLSLAAIGGLLLTFAL